MAVAPPPDAHSTTVCIPKTMIHMPVIASNHHEAMLLYRDRSLSLLFIPHAYIDEIDRQHDQAWQDVSSTMKCSAAPEVCKDKNVLFCNDHDICSRDSVAFRSHALRSQRTRACL